MTKLKILPKKRRFEYLNIVDILHMPDLKWVIQDIITEGALGQLYGPSGVGKSFVTLDMALSIATGTKWLGTYDVFQGPVIYVAAEGSRGYKKRIISWLDHHNLHQDSLLENFRMIGEALPLSEPGDVRQLIKDVQEEIFPDRTLRFIVLDTQARCTVGLEEEKSSLGIAVAAADRIKDTTGAAVKLVHHTGLNEKRDRGWTGMFGSLDFQSSLAGSGAPEHRLTLTSTKTKDDKEFDDIPIHLKQVGDSLVSVIRKKVSAIQYLKSS